MKSSFVILCLALLSVQQGVFGAGETELASIDFGGIIGGVLTAVVDAQALSSQTTINFINSIGFEEPAAEGAIRKARVMEFGWDQIDDDGTSVARKMSVPLLALVHTPYLRVDSVTIDMSMKISGASNQRSTSDSVNYDVSGRAAWGRYGHAYQYKGSVSRAAEDGTRSVKSEYGVQVRVVATNAESPEGFAKVMDKMLEATFASDDTSGF